MSYSCDLGPEFYRTETPVARKEYECVECYAPILPGERYVKCVGVWEGELSTHRQHLLCCEACEWVRDQDGECLPFGYLFNYWEDDANQGHPNFKELRPILARIKFRHRRFVRAARKSRKGG